MKKMLIMAAVVCMGSVAMAQTATQTNVQENTTTTTTTTTVSKVKPAGKKGASCCASKADKSACASKAEKASCEGKTAAVRQEETAPKAAPAAAADDAN